MPKSGGWAPVFKLAVMECLSRLMVRMLLAYGSVFFLSVVDLAASGSYIGGGPRPPRQIKPELYHLGKSVYAGKVATKDLPSLRDEQNQLLLQYQKRLPRTVQSKIDLSSLAGKLDEEQMTALIYFLEIRYKIKIADDKSN